MIKKKKISQEDNDTWLDYIKNPTDLIDKENAARDNVSNNYRFKYDLHGHTLLDANDRVKKIILFCVQDGYQEILLITGKGIHSNTDNNIYASKDLSKLKYSVPDFINTNPDISKYISSISNAEKKDGGEGALIIKLKKL